MSGYNGILGIDHVQEGEYYWVVNGLWKFKVLSVQGDMVEIEHRHGKTTLHKSEARDINKAPLWIEE